MRLTEIKEQEVAVSTLTRAIEANKISHGYLFHGESGVGKATTARSFAKQIFCETQTSCGQCSQCLKFVRGNHPGFISGGTSIKIDQIREVHQQVHYTQDHYQVWIIDSAHKMTLQAANSFLKLLEEPPEKTVFILITNNLDQILPTIRSRCQLVGFRRLSDRLVKDLLTINIDPKPDDEQRVMLITKIARGSIGRAIDLWDSPVLERREWLINQLIRIPDLSMPEILGLSQNWDENRDLVSLDLEMILQWYRDLWCVKNQLDKQLFNLDYLHELSIISQKYTEQTLAQLTKLILEMLSKIERNVRVRFIMGSLLIQMKKGVFA